MYARAYSTYDQLLIQNSLLTNKLMSQGFLLSRLKAAFRKFYSRYNDVVRQYGLSLDQMLSDVFHANRWAILGALLLTAVCTIYLNWN
jgi:hypothetical protein